MCETARMCKIFLALLEVVKREIVIVGKGFFLHRFETSSSHNCTLQTKRHYPIIIWLILTNYISEQCCDREVCLHGHIKTAIPCDTASSEQTNALTVQDISYHISSKGTLI